MAEKDKIYSTKTKHTGIFSFKDFYVFCHDFLSADLGLTVVENSYKEKISGDQKTIEFEWTASKKFTDYFKFEMGISAKADPLKKVQIMKDGAKVDTNSGTVEISIKGTLIKDYDGKFEKSAWHKFLRGVYEKWIIKSRVDQFEDKVAGDCDDFVKQIKAYLDLEGRK